MGSHHRFWVQIHWCAGEKPCWPFATKLDLWLPTASWLGGPLCSQNKKNKKNKNKNSSYHLEFNETPIIPIPKGRWIFTSHITYIDYLHFTSFSTLTRLK
jgi:hypothetical protein